MEYTCPECGSTDIDLNPDGPEDELICLECGWEGPFEDLDGEWGEPSIHDEPPPDFGPPGSGAVITEYQVGTYEEPW